jgi:A/G-specific adenine glycosylase
MADPDALPREAREAILGWYTAYDRRLPFRATRDPYAILVSEAMAQQTQAVRAGESWRRFMDRFPTVEALASATPADVLRAWQGLGYNRRALNLWHAARRIVDVHGGEVPADLAALEALPGVGPYTARAVAAIAFGMVVCAVDTNVRRVLGRIVAGDATALSRTELQGVADAAVPVDRAGAWTHALMDLGATICGPRQPDCPSCPARAWCAYARTGVPAGPLRPRRPPPRAPRTPFPATTRWLRGQIVDRLRDASHEEWVSIQAPIGRHDDAAVHAALSALAREGLVEIRDQDGGSGPRPGQTRLARLALA